MVAEVQQNFGNAAHADSADSYKVNVFNSLEHTLLERIPSSAGGGLVEPRALSSDGMAFSHS